MDYTTKRMNEISDEIIMDSIALNAILKVNSNNFINGHRPTIKNTIASSLVARELEKIAEENPAYGKLLSEKFGYDKREAMLRQLNADMDKRVAEFEVGGFKCPKSKKGCEEDDSICFFKKYATATNASEKIGEIFPLKDYEIASIKHDITASLLSCNPAIGKFTILYITQ